MVKALPNTSFLPVPKSAPAGHTTAAAHLLWQVFPRYPCLEYKDNSGQSCPVRYTWTASFGCGLMFWQKWFYLTPQFVAYQFPGHLLHPHWYFTAYSSICQVLLGALSRERLEDAVTRILATKAALHLPEKKSNGSIYKTADDLSVLACPEHLQWAQECADAGVTLVKDTQNLLPLSAEKTPRVLLQLLGDYPSNGRVKAEVEQLMKAEGFQITWYQPETLETIFNTESAEEFRAKYDLVLYIGNIETASNKTVARINWHTLFGLGNNMPWFVHEVPTLFVSLGNPYHLLDVPMIKTYINGYCNAPTVIHAIVDKLMGRSSFKGKSPVDPFCGKWDTRL